MLTVENLYYKYPDGHEALKGVSFSLARGEKVALVGANGSGKSTLLLHIAGALEVQSGKIFFDGVSGSEILRQKVGLTFQDANDQILMPSVLEDVAFSLTAGGVNFRDARERAMKILASLGISHLSERPPHKLSGGERRLVSIAGVLAKDPDVLALDEPAAALDPRARRRVINFLRDSDKTILLASHDLDMTIDICSRAIILHDGSIAASGELPEFFTHREILEANGLELPLRYLTSRL